MPAARAFEQLVTQSAASTAPAAETSQMGANSSPASSVQGAEGAALLAGAFGALVYMGRRRLG